MTDNNNNEKAEILGNEYGHCKMLINQKWIYMKRARDANQVVHQIEKELDQFDTAMIIKIEKELKDEERKMLGAKHGQL